MECHVTDLRDAIDGLQAIDTDVLSDGELSALLVDLHAQSARLEAALVALTSAWDTRRAWSADGAKSPAAWLAHRTHRPRAAVNGEVRLARRLRGMPATAAALAAGEISSEHAGRLARANRPGLEADFSRDEELLVGHARDLGWADFVRAVAYWEQLAAPDDTEPTPSPSTRPAGPTGPRPWMEPGCSTLLDPVSGAIVDDTLSGIEADLFATDWAKAKAEHGDDVTLDRLARTPAQRRADALVEMATRARTAPVDGQRPRPLVSVLVDYPTLTGRVCELADGTIVAPSALAELLGGADIERIVFNGGSRVIDVGRRTRFFTGALRRAIQVRDRHCTWPGCDTPAERCEIDHIVPYEDGGTTTQDNGRLRCPYHHHLGHRHRPP